MSTQAVATQILRFKIQYSSLALLYYDYGLTLPMEVKHIWGQKFRVSTILYICCRYALIGNVLFLLAIANKLTHNCDSWYKTIGALSVLGRSAVIFTMAMKTFAIYGQNKYVLAYFSILGLACIALDIVSRLNAGPSIFSPLTGSFAWSKVHWVVQHRCTFLYWPKSRLIIFSANDLLGTTMLAVEYSAGILMLIRSVQAFRVGGQWNKKNKGFMFLIFEQGLFYFAVVTLLTTASVVLNFVAPSSDWFLQRLLNALILPLSCLLTARFILHLRAYDARSRANDTLSNITSLDLVSSPSVLRVAITDFGDDLIQTVRREYETVPLERVRSSGR